MSEEGRSAPSTPDPRPEGRTLDARAGARLAPSSPRVVSSDQLLHGASELVIDHDGVLYRLKRTALGKLILTK